MARSKVLFIDARKGSDFTLDAVWAGLVHYFGVENVVDYGPCRDKHREGVPKITGNAEADYGAERRSLCYTPEHASLKNYTREEINQIFKDDDFAFVFIDERWESYELYLQLNAKWFNVPVVVISGHDKFWNEDYNRPLNVLTRYYGKNLKHLFIDNWKYSYNGNDMISPMSYATNFDHLWDVNERQSLLENKVYDVCFMGYNSHGTRATLVDHLLRKYGSERNCLFVEKRPNTIECFLSKREYFRKMAQSRICINMLGAAECGKTLRFYEIPYVGSYMLSQKDNARQVHPFIEYPDNCPDRFGHCGYFSTIEELDRKINDMLELPNIREHIAAQGHRHAMTYHTAQQRIFYIMDRIL